MKTLDHRNLEATPEYRFVKNQLEKLKKDYTEELVTKASKGLTAEVQFLAGKLNMIEEMIGLPEFLMPAHKEEE